MAAKPPMVEFKNVSKIYPGGKVAVENINLRIERGIRLFYRDLWRWQDDDPANDQRYADSNWRRYYCRW